MSLFDRLLATKAINLTRGFTATSVSSNHIDLLTNRIITTGHSLAGDGGSAAYRRVTSIPAHPGYLTSADGAIWEINEPALRPKMFGGDNNSSTYDDPAWINIIAVAHALYLPIYLSGNSINKIATPFTLDFTKTYIKGDGGATLNFSAAPSTGDMITIGFSNNRNPTAAPAISNVNIVLAGNQNWIKFSSGDPQQAKFSCIRDCFVSGGASHYIFGDNTFLTKIINVQHYNFSGTSYTYISPVINSGENVLFLSCYWGTTSATYPNAMVFNLDTGYTTFLECSFDYLPKIGIMGSNNTAPMVRIIGGHVELDYTTGGGALSTAGLGGVIDYYCGDLHFAPGGLALGGGLNKAIIVMGNVGNSTGNVHFECNRITFFGTWNSSVRFFIDKNTSSYSTVSVGKINYNNMPPTIKFMQAVKGNGLLPILATGWDSSYTGTPGTLSTGTDSTVAASHAAGLGNFLQIIVPPSSTMIVSSKALTIDYATRLICDFYYRLPTMSSGTVSIVFTLYDLAGVAIQNTVNSLSLTQSSVSATWVRFPAILKILTTSIHQEIASIKVVISVTNTSASNSAEFDVGIPNMQKI